MGEDCQVEEVEEDCQFATALVVFSPLLSRFGATSASLLATKPEAESARARMESVYFMIAGLS